MFSYAAQRIRSAEALLTPGEVLPTGIPALDAVLPGGGFPRGRLSELAGGRSCGKRALVAALCARTIGEGHAAVWIDGTGEFYPLPALEHGAPLDRLIVVRLPPRSPSAGEGPAARAPRRGQRRASGCPPALKAADLLMQASGAASLVVVDLPVAMRVPPRLLSRLRLGAETSGAAVIFITETVRREQLASLGTFICLRLCVARAGVSRARVTITKSKLGRMAHQALVSLDEPHGLHLDPTL